MVRDPQANMVPPQTSTTTPATTATPRHKVPGRSTRTGRRAAAEAGSQRQTATAAARPSGTFTQNTHRQPTESVSPPPTTGPPMAAAANTAPMTPSTRARRLGATTSATTASTRISRPPPPRPCSTRAAITISIEGATPPTIEPATNTNSAAVNTRRRPTRSPSRPRIGMTTAPASTYPVPIHSCWPTPPRSPTTVGNAVANTDWSSSVSSNPTDSATSTSNVRGFRSSAGMRPLSLRSWPSTFMRTPPPGAVRPGSRTAIRGLGPIDHPRNGRDRPFPRAAVVFPAAEHDQVRFLCVDVVSVSSLPSPDGTHPEAPGSH